MNRQNRTFDGSVRKPQSGFLGMGTNTLTARMCAFAVEASDNLICERKLDLFWMSRASFYVPLQVFDCFR